MKNDDVCRHRRLHLVTGDPARLRCRKCHLTIRVEELSAEFCPECFEKDGVKRNDFEKIEIREKGSYKYRCEDCGIMIEG